MKYYIIAGEASGDLHGSNMLAALKQLDAQAEFRGWGGDKMKFEGMALVKHYRDLAFMGFLEVITNLRTILRNIAFCKEDLLAHRPDVLILIDYPGFNLRIAEFAHANGIRVYYYISPQLWAWKQSRIHQIKKHVERMFVILPFEKEFYAKFDMQVDFVGHPLLDAIHNFRLPVMPEPKEGRKPIIALLPGSRRQEINTSLPIMLSQVERFPDFKFVIAGAPSIPNDFYEKWTKNSDVKIWKNQTYSLLEQSSAALVTSGTATLETALFRVPEVVCYKGSKVSYLIAKQLVKVKYISLVNLIMDAEVVKELIQDDFNPEMLQNQLERILFNKKYKEELQNNYEKLIEKLGGPGASAQVAKLVIHYLKEGK